MQKNYVIQKIRSDYYEDLNRILVHICGQFQNLPNHCAKREGIGEYIVIYCISGSGYVMVQGKKQSIHSGDLIFLDRDTPHEYGSAQTDPWSIVWMHLAGGLKTLYPIIEKHSDHGVIALGYHNRLYQLFLDLIKGAENPTTITEILKLNQSARLVLCEILTLLESEHDCAFTDQMKAYLCAHCTENPTLDELAHQFAVSKYHMIRKFKKATGYTPIEFLFRQKIELACHLLIDTNDTITSISRQLGYHTPYYFSEQFKAITGYAPSIFRKLVDKEYL